MQSGLIHLRNLNTVYRETTHCGDTGVADGEDLDDDFILPDCAQSVNDDLNLRLSEIQVSNDKLMHETHRNSYEISEKVTDCRAIGSNIFDSVNDKGGVVQVSETSVIDSPRSSITHPFNESQVHLI